MTCKHAPGDTSCSNHPSNIARSISKEYETRVNQANKEVEDLLARTPNPKVYEILRVEEVEENLVMEVRYSSCKNCSFDSKKVMVFHNTSIKDVIFWRKIDPHFSEAEPGSKKVSPSPSARFPASEEGWIYAMKFAKMLTPNLTRGL